MSPASHVVRAAAPIGSPVSRQLPGAPRAARPFALARVRAPLFALALDAPAVALLWLALRRLGLLAFLLGDLLALVLVALGLLAFLPGDLLAFLLGDLLAFLAGDFLALALVALALVAWALALLRGAWVLGFLLAGLVADSFAVKSLPPGTVTLGCPTPGVSFIAGWDIAGCSWGP